jgi:hypothetical protein
MIKEIKTYTIKEFLLNEFMTIKIKIIFIGWNLENG